MDQQLGRPVLIEFWDFCRANSIRTLPYMKAWHERYAERGLRVIGVHAPGSSRRSDPDAVRDGGGAPRQCRYPVVVDTELEIWELYGNLGWPARYLFDQRRDAVRAPLRRGRLRRDRAGDPGAARDRRAAARAVPPRGRARTRCSSRRARTSRARTAGRTAPAACGRCSTGAATVTANGRTLDRRAPRLLRADLPRAEHERRARARDRRPASAATRSASRRV